MITHRFGILRILTPLVATLCAGTALAAPSTEANVPVEIAFQAAKSQAEPFRDVSFDVVFTDPSGQAKTVPGFWAGGNQWKVRYASPATGTHRYRSVCSTADDSGLQGVEGTLEIRAYSGSNPLYRHGPLRVSAHGRHFEHGDGTPFFWLGDTWWKNLCKRMTWEGFQELTADRKAKGFTVVQIVCGPYPDEDAFEDMWENEGGKPYLDQKFTRTNPAYFDYADRRFKHLIAEGIVPAIVGCWARADCDSMKFAGVEGLKRHWRQLVARYGAYPVVWIVAGEVAEELRYGKGPWGEVAKHLRSVDPFLRPSTSHAGSGHAEPLVVDFDMVGGSHDATVAVQPQVLGAFHAAYAGRPPVPVLCGETAYEGHMQQAWHDVQRQMFWMFVLSGAAGHTYGAAGVWHAGVEGDPGQASGAFGGRKVYDWTTWREGMNYPGATQIGLGKKLLEAYPWWRFEPHPDWAEAGSYAAGIPGEVRFIYQPRRTIYNWKGTVVKNLESDVAYSAFYFDPATGRRFDQGIAKNRATYAPIDGHVKPPLFVDLFNENAVGADAKGEASAWKDYGTPTQRKEGGLIGSRGMVTIVDTLATQDLMVSADATSKAEAGIILRFHDPDNYIVALYSPILKCIFIHDRKNGSWGGNLGQVGVPEIGPQIHLTAAVTGDYAALVVSDGKTTWRTPAVTVQNKTAGKPGVWLYQPGEQKFDNFEVSDTTFAPVDASAAKGEKARNYDYKAPDLPSPQDWILVLERVKKP